MENVTVVFDNKNVKVVEGDKVIAQGNDPRYHAFARNVIDTSEVNGYNVNENTQGHKRVVTLSPKG